MWTVIVWSCIGAPLLGPPLLFCDVEHRGHETGRFEIQAIDEKDCLSKAHKKLTPMWQSKPLPPIYIECVKSEKPQV